MSYRNSNTTLLIVFLLGVISLGCSEDPVYKGDSIIGYWQALKKTNITLDGIPGTPYEEGFYIRFLDNNCGSLYDRDENWTNDIKWVFQEREIEDLLYISTALNSSGQSSFLSTNAIGYLEKFEEMNFRTYSIDTSTINGVFYKRGHRTFFVRQ